MAKTTSPVLDLRIQCNGYEDRGACIVIRLKPLIVLVPSHVIVAIEDGAATGVLLDGIRHDPGQFEILPSPALERDHLAAVRVRANRLRPIKRIRLPRQPLDPQPGAAIDLWCPRSGCQGQSGRVSSIATRGVSQSLETDIPVKPGDSGGAIAIDEMLVGVCMGRKPTNGSSNGAGTAVAVPLTRETLHELCLLRRRAAVRLVAPAAIGVGVIALLGIALTWYSWSSFQLGAVEISEDELTVTVSNNKSLTVHGSWSAKFTTEARRVHSFSRTPGGPTDMLAVGTWYREGEPGSINLLDRNGRLLWSYTVPDGECIYPSEGGEILDDFLVTLVDSFDLNADGESELIVNFVHNSWYPSKLMVFSLDGEILAEYWHRGYVRTLLAFEHPDSTLPMLAVTASNNALKPEGQAWHPQTIFAFEGLRISGQSPPYEGAAPMGTELWYYEIVNVDAELKRAKCKAFTLSGYLDHTSPAIRASLSDGQFLFFDIDGSLLGVEYADVFVRDFGDIDAPEPLQVPLRMPPEYYLEELYKKQDLNTSLPSSGKGAGGAVTEAIAKVQELLSPIEIRAQRASDTTCLRIDGFSVDHARFLPAAWLASDEYGDYRTLADGESCVSVATLMCAQSSAEEFLELRFSSPFDASNYRGIEFEVCSEEQAGVRVEILCAKDTECSDPDAAMEALPIYARILPTIGEPIVYRIPFYHFRDASWSGTSAEGEFTWGIARERIIGVRFLPDDALEMGISYVAFYR